MPCYFYWRGSGIAASREGEVARARSRDDGCSLTTTRRACQSPGGPAAQPFGLRMILEGG